MENIYSQYLRDLVSCPPPICAVWSLIGNTNKILRLLIYRVSIYWYTFIFYFTRERGDQCMIVTQDIQAFINDFQSVNNI